MRIMVELLVDFTKVSREQWDNVYQESLKLIDGYEFMDKIVDEEQYPDTLVYSTRSRERYLTPWQPERLGWYIIGDMKTNQHAESFILYKDIDAYLSNDLTGEPKEGIVDDVYSI